MYGLLANNIMFVLIIAGVYGDVVRVKILYNKRDSALIQFKEPQHAQTGTFLSINQFMYSNDVSILPFN